MEKILCCSLLVLIAACIVHRSDAAMSEAQMRQAMKAVRNMCMPKSGVSKDALSKMMVGEFDDDDRKLKCYLGCVMNMMQLVKNGKINLTMVKNQVTKMLEPTWAAKIMASFEQCQGVAGSDNCDMAYNFAKCLYAADKEAFIIP